MVDVVLAAVDTADLHGRAVLGFTRYPELAPFHTGTGDLNLLCGGCRFVLAAHLTDRESVSRLLIRCPACGAYNENIEATRYPPFTPHP